MSIQSADGRYRAEAVFNVLGPLKGTYEIRYPTNYEESLRGLSGKEIAVLVRLRGYDKVESIIVPACFGSRTLAGEVELLLNSGDVDLEIIPGQPDGNKVVATCTSKLLDDAIAYDTSCTVEAAPNSVSSLWIIRRYFDRFLPRLEVEVFLP